MRAFTCDHCGQLIFFANSRCLRCGSPLGYVHARRDLVALADAGAGRLVDPGQPDRTWRRCATALTTGCNWLVAPGARPLCESCALTRTRPADSDREGMGEFVRAEMAKRRLVFQLAELGLPVQPRNESARSGLAFDLLSSVATKVITGHDNGIITLDLAEADDEHRERLRLQLAEPYRTLLGHFRHEIGHYYWPILVAGPVEIEACRALFGDDREDYAGAVERHYRTSADDDGSWATTYISRYATMHPYEDWAETFAHYLHILDTLQTAEGFGIGTRHHGEGGEAVAVEGGDVTRPDGCTSFAEVIDHWLQLSYALNQINQSMGRDDLYPFVLAPTVVRKLTFVDRLIHAYPEAPPVPPAETLTFP